jgi:hypothetical protein
VAPFERLDVAGQAPAQVVESLYGEDLAKQVLTGEEHRGTRGAAGKGFSEDVREVLGLLAFHLQATKS